jgi:hypothetical protein
VLSDYSLPFRGGSNHGFSSDEDGVRHSLIQGTESIDEETAFYFLGSCAGFITLLTHKARRHKLKEEQDNT